MTKPRNDELNVNRRDVLKLGSASVLTGLAGASGAQELSNPEDTQETAQRVSRDDMPQSTLIKNAYVISMDEDVGDIDGGDILIRDGLIVEIGKGLSASVDEVFDAKGCIVLPGFIDGHRHLWQTPMRGAGTGWSFMQYRREMLYKRAACYKPSDMHVAGVAGGLEALNAGVTTVVNHCHNNRSPAHAEASLQGMMDSGIGGIYAYSFGRTPEYGPGASVTSDEIATMLADGPQWRLDHATDFKDQFFKNNDSHVSLGIVTSFFETFAVAHPDQAIEEMHRARALGVDLITQHVRARGEFRAVNFLNDEGLLGEDLMISHADGVSASEFEMIRRNGGSIVVTPETEIKGGNSPARARALHAGLDVGLGMDTVIMVGGDMFGPMRWLLQFQRNEHYRSRTDCDTNLSPPDIGDRSVLHAATIGGAKAIGLSDSVGSLTPGKLADVVLFKTNSLTMQPVNDPVAAIVHFANTSDIDSVWKAGMPVKRGGRLTTHDTAEVMRDLVASRDRILSEANTIRID